MPADFTTFQDDTLSNIDLVEVFFATPNVDENKNANLAFRVNPSVGAESVTLRVEINDQLILEQTFDSDPQRVWQENFSGSILSSDNNKLELRKTGGNGDVSVSDFIVHFKTV